MESKGGGGGISFTSLEAPPAIVRGMGAVCPHSLLTTAPDRYPDLLDLKVPVCDECVGPCHVYLVAALWPLSVAPWQVLLLGHGRCVPGAQAPCLQP